MKPKDEGYTKQIQSLFTDGGDLIGAANFQDKKETLFFLAGVVSLQTGRKIMIITTAHQDLIKEFSNISKRVLPAIVGLKYMSCLIVDISNAKSILVNSDDEFAQSFKQSAASMKSAKLWLKMQVML